MTIVPDRIDILDTIELRHGAHRSMDDGACLLEAVSWIAGEPFSDHRRAWMACDWLIRTYTPAFLRLARLDEQADALANAAEIRNRLDVKAIRPAVDRAVTDARAARDAAGDAARAAARAAAGDAARDAARDALRSTVVELQESAIELFDRMILTTDG